MLTDYGTPFRQRLIHPTLRDIILGIVSHEPDPGMPWPDDPLEIAIARCTGDAKTRDDRPGLCRCGAFPWPHMRDISSRCHGLPVRRLRLVVSAPEIDFTTETTT